jgi:hypothetical protein
MLFAMAGITTVGGILSAIGLPGDCRRCVVFATLRAAILRSHCRATSTRAAPTAALFIDTSRAIGLNISALKHFISLTRPRPERNPGWGFSSRRVLLQYARPLPDGQPYTRAVMTPAAASA